MATPRPTKTPRGRFALTVTLCLLTALAVLAGWMVLTDASFWPAKAQSAQPAAQPAPQEATTVAASLGPRDPWLRPAPGATLRRIAIGSCLDQKKPQPIWSDVITAKPDLMLMIGDNVYGDIKSAEQAELRLAYREQALQPEFAAARSKISFLATWDDHDYGLNDAGERFAEKQAAADIFRDFWQLPDAKPAGGGIYYSRLYGPEGQRVQVIMLDTRSFRSDLKGKGPGFPHWGKYEPDPTPGKTMLGEAQWAWLEGELRKPAEIRILASSIQVLAEGHGFERWGNLPSERDRLLGLIRATGAKGVVMVSGDRHSAALFRQEGRVGYGLFDLTSSSMNRSYGPSKDTRMAPLVSEIYHQENFGLIDIDWTKREIAFELKGIGGVSYTRLTAPFADIGVR